MRVALDSNIIIYAEGLSDDPRNGIAQKLILAIAADQLVIPAQAVSETLFWLIRRAKLPRAEACISANLWASKYVLQPVDGEVLAGAMQLVADHQLQVFDAIILASAAEASADMLLSEDMQHGFRWQGVTVVNPFLPEAHPLLKTLTLSKI